MKVRFFVFAAAFFVAFCPLASLSVQGSWTSSPLGPSTVPPSSINSSLVDTPDPIDTAGNLLITGNVRRGMHFRGDVPYQSPTSFGSTLGSSTLSSFLRDTAGPEDFGSYSQTFHPQPYYSPTETVTTMIPGRPEVFSPMSVPLNTRAQQDTRMEGTNAFGTDVSPAVPMTLTPGRAAELAAQGPRPKYYLFEDSRLTAEEGLSLGSANPERLTSGWVGPGRESEMSAGERLGNRAASQETINPAQTPPADSSLGFETSPTVSNLDGQQRWPTSNGSFQYPNPTMNTEALKSGFEPQVPPGADAEAKQSRSAEYGISRFDELASSNNPALRDGSALQKGVSWPDANQKLRSDQYTDSVRNETANAERGAQSASVQQNGALSQGVADQSQRDVLERIKEQLEDLTRSVEAGLQNVPSDPAQTVKTTTAAKPESLRSDTQSHISGVPGAELPQTNNLMAPAQKEASALDQFKQLSHADVSAEAKRIMGSYTSLESLTGAKFDEHIRAAEEHLRAGRYYRAADSFALAAVYKPDDPLVLAGQSHALFAAGEYVSSALFLSRALAICPEYLQVRVDLAGLLGGRDKVAQRLADVEQWYARSGSGQLQLLLSYVYYRTGNLTQARRTVDAVYEKMPELPAVRAMKAAIDGATR